MAGSRSFSGQSPQIPHLAAGHGVGKEIGDLRADVETAFKAIEAEVDVITGPRVKHTVRAATTGALAANTRTGNELEADVVGAFGTLDGVTLVEGVDYILVKNEVAGLKNGVYLVTSLGSGGSKWKLTRSALLDTSAEMLSGILIAVEEGTVNADTLWQLDTNNPIDLNVTSLSFTKAAISAATLASTASGKGASLVGVQDSANLYTSGTVEGALAEAGSFIRVKELTFTSADLVALGATKTGALNVGTALPTGARLAGAEISVATLFQDVGDTATLVADLGTSTAGHEDWGVDGGANNMHTTGLKTGGTNAATFGRSVSTEQGSIKFTCSVNLSTLTAGEATARIWYFILA